MTASMIQNLIKYSIQLKDGALVINRAFPNYLKQLENCNTQFIDIIFSKEKINNKSYENEAEGLASIHICNAIIDEIERLKRAYPEKQENPSIGIITPYKQQTKLISELVRKMIPRYFHKFIQVNTVDSFQGQEKDIIIFTTVRVNSKEKWRDNMIGFLQDERRMNVALTRARFCLIVLGHADTLNSNPVWGAFVDFMAKNNKYGKLRNRDALSDVGKYVLKGSLLEGSSANYVKKDWGDEYREMLLKNNQVNELKLTDFEAVEEGEQTNQASPSKQVKLRSEGQDMINEDMDSDTIKNSGEKNYTSDMIDENENYKQRTGISLKEALEKQEEKKQIQTIIGGFGGLTGLVDQPKLENNVECGVFSAIRDDDDDNVSDNQNAKETIQKDDDIQQINKQIAEKKSNDNKNDDPSKQDIYEIMKQQKKENLLKQKKEKMMNEKKSPKTTFSEPATYVEDSIKQKSSDIDSSKSQQNTQTQQKQVPSNNDYKKPQKQNDNQQQQQQKPAQSNNQKQVSSNNSKSGFSLLTAITQTTKIQPTSAMTLGGLSGLVEQEAPQINFKYDYKYGGSNNQNSNQGVSIYDQISQQREQKQLEKKKPENKSSSNQKPKPSNPEKTQSSSNNFSSLSSPQNKNSNTKESNIPKSNKPSSSSQSNNQQYKSSSNDSKQSKSPSSKPEQGKSDSYQNSLDLLKEYTNSRNTSSNPLQDLIKTKPQFKQPSKK